jgi:hypothetical protein
MMDGKNPSFGIEIPPPPPRKKKGRKQTTTKAVQATTSVDIVEIPPIVTNKEKVR